MSPQSHVFAPLLHSLVVVGMERVVVHLAESRIEKV